MILPVSGIEFVDFGCSAWPDDGVGDDREARDENVGVLVEESVHGGGCYWKDTLLWIALLEKYFFILRDWIFAKQCK